MKKENMLSALVAAMLPAAVLADLSATVTSLDWNAEKRQFTVGYELSGGGAMVTFDVLDGTTPLGGEKLRAAYGEINMRVAAGSHSFVWQADNSWKGTANNVTIRVRAWAYDNPPPYMSVACFGSHAVNYYAGEAYLPHAVTNQYYKQDAILFKKIPAKGITWTMGTAGATGHDAPHRVTFTNDYYVGVYPLTLGQYRNMARWDSDSGNYGTINAAGGENAPAIAHVYTADMSEYGRARPLVWAASFRWYIRDVESDSATAGVWPRHGHALIETSSTRFLKRLRGYAPGYAFDYPTEAQWEYACRGGKGTKYCNGSDSNPDSVAWYAGNNTDDPNWTEGLPHAVGLKEPNGFGLYDIMGNVREGCLDNWGEDTALPDAIDPPGPAYEDVPWAVNTERVGQKVGKGTAFHEASVRGCGQYFTYDPGRQAVELGVRLFCVAEYSE